MIRLDKYQAATQHLRSLVRAAIVVYLLLSVPWPFNSKDGHGRLFSVLVISCVVIGIVLRARGGAKSSSCPAVDNLRLKQETLAGRNASWSRNGQLPQKTDPLSVSSDKSVKEKKELKRNTPSPKPKTKSQPSNSLPSKDSSVDVLTNPSLFPDNLFNTICTYLNPRDVTTCLAPASKSARVRADANAIWWEYWHRDYGNALLEWDVAREVLGSSVGLEPSSSKLELKRALSQTLSNLKSTKEFFFQFGECWINFILAGYNDPKTNCLVGLHGHVFDFGAFAPFHPGLVDRILRDCGQDATEAFETIRHSRPARVLASMTCLIVSCRRADGGQYLKLAKQIDPEIRHAVFRESNTRPPRSGDRDEARRLLPRVPKAGRPAILARIRVQLDQDKSENQRSLPSSVWRLYYNPIQQRWMRWNSTIMRDSISPSPRVDHLRSHASYV